MYIVYYCHFRKRKIIASKYHQEELEAKKVVMKAKKVTDIPEETAFDKHLQDAVKPGLKSRLELRGKTNILVKETVSFFRGTDWDK